MNAIRIQHAIHADRAARFQAEAHHHRFGRSSRPAGERRIRRALGRSMVRLGARIAAEPVPERLMSATAR